VGEKAKKDLAGKVAIVTGSGRGLGWAIAERLAQEEARVVIAEIDGASAQEKAAVLRQRKGESLAIRTDVSRWPEVQKMVTDTVEKFGRIDILVNNAGILDPGLSIEECPEDQWDKVIAVNLKGTFLCCKAVLPVMKKQGSGSIVNIASVAGKEGNPNMGPYSVSKGAIITLTKTLGKELASTRIRINAVSPALLETDMARNMSPEQRAFLTSKIPMGRLGDPAEVAAVVKFLVSDEASFVTGQCYDVSGGRSVY
jgi:NAD(P)-dependent dehydrogenase (short-subunit alcohol dehydrogenase family)